MRGWIGLVLLLCLSVPLSCFAQESAQTPERGPEPPPPPAASPVPPPVAQPPAAPPCFLGAPQFQGPLALVHPSPAQWIALTRIGIKNARVFSQEMSELTALRLEIMGMLAAETVDQTVIEAKLGSMGEHLTKLTGQIVEAIFEVREVLTPEQRQTALSSMCLRLLNRPMRQKPEQAARIFQQVGERMPHIRDVANHLGLTTEQRARLKRLALHHAPIVIRAGGEVLGQVLLGAEELLAENPSKEKVKGAAESAAKRIIEVLKCFTLAVKEARGVLTPAQVEMMVARLPIKLLIAGPMVLKK